MGKKLFVGRLSYSTTDETLRAGFEPFGTVVEARVIFNRDTGESRLFGFVTFDADEQAAEAMEKMDGATLDGRTIRVNEAEERRGGAPGGAPRGAPRGRGRPGGPGGPGGAPEVHTRGRPRRSGDDNENWSRPGYRPGAGRPSDQRGQRSDRGGPPGGDRGRPGGPPQGRGGPGGRPGGGRPGGGRPGGPGGRPGGPGGRPGGGGGFPPAPAFGEPDKNDWGADRKRRTEITKKKKKKRTDEEFGGPRSAPKRDRRKSGRTWRDYTVGEDEEEEFE